MSYKRLVELAKLDNIATELTADELGDVTLRASSGFDDDQNSCTEWLAAVKKVMELASLQSSPKNTPLPQSANIKFPIIAKAAYEFASRTYPELVKDGKVVKCRVIGKDISGEKTAQADRVADFMNYQLMFLNQDWEQELDRSLTMLSLVGFLCKKTYYDPIRHKIKSEICNPEDLIVNADIKSLEDAPRINHIITLKMKDLIEHVRAGIFLEEPVQELIDQYAEHQLVPDFKLVEQHTFLDLDEDDYEEPYIVTYLKDTNKIVRIAPRFDIKNVKHSDDEVQYIDADHYFTDYHFLVNPKGKFQSVGFGILMLHLNESINTILNQLTDAGTLSNMQTGIIDSKAKFLSDGTHKVSPGELVKVKSSIPLRDAVSMIDYKEPSQVLLQLLQLLISAAKDLSSSTEVMSGGSSPDNVKSGAMFALIEQGMKVFTAIQKRIYRSLSQEYRKIFHLNSRFLDPRVYAEVLDDDLAVEQKDFDEADIRVIPVADPNLSSDVTRMAQAQFIAGLAQAPGIKPEEITKYLIETSKIPNPQRFLMSPEEMQQQKQQPNPDVIKIQGELEGHAQELNIKGKELELEERKFKLDVLKAQSEIALNLAKAESLETGSKLSVQDMQLKAIQSQLDHLLEVGSLSLQDKQHQDQMALEESYRQDEMANRGEEDAAAQQPSTDSGIPGSSDY